VIYDVDIKKAASRKCNAVYKAMLDLHAIKISNAVFVA